MLRALVLVLVLALTSRLSECKVRLVGGSSSSEGRVEIFHNGEWGTVCDDRWDLQDAKVVCRSLRLPDAISATTLANFGDGSGRIWLDEVKCRGDEKSLTDCQHREWGKHNCHHGEDAGVVCGHPSAVNMDVINLFGVIDSPGYPHFMQRGNNTWTFRPTAPNTDVYLCFEYFDLSTYREGMSNASVQDSKNSEIFFMENSARRDVCVLMENAGGKLTYYASLTASREDRGRGFRVRYVAVDRSQAEGFCSNNWDISYKGEAGKIELSWDPPAKQSRSGYTYLIVHKSSASQVRANLTNSTSVFIDYLHPSTEYSIRVIAVPLTYDPSYVLYSCSKRVRTKDDINRIIDGKSANEGFVQVYRNGQWTRVCGGYSWEMRDANVFCRSMGLVAENTFSHSPRITKKNVQRLRSNRRSEQSMWAIRCSGREKSLLSCRSSWTRFCFAAGVVCSNPPASIWRLFGGTLPNEGMLEVYNKGEWGRVCSSRWSLNEAKAACSSLGLPPPPFLLKPVLRRYWRPRRPGSYLDPFTLRVKRKTWIKNPKCRGNKKSLSACGIRMRSTKCRSKTEFVNLVCGQPRVEQIIVNDTSGVITSPGYPRSAKQAHVEWIFKPTASQNAKVLLWSFDTMDLSRKNLVSNERSSLTIQDGAHTLFSLENKPGELKVVMGTRDVKLSFYSSFTYVHDDFRPKKTGFHMRYLVSNRLCHENWNMSVEVKPGRVPVSWTTIKHGGLRYKYVVVYNWTRGDLKIIHTVKTSVQIDNIPPNTLFSVGVLAYPLFYIKSTAFYFCSVKDFHTDKATTRLVGGTTPFEGHIQIFHQGRWGTIANDDDYDLNDAKVACSSMGLPTPTFYNTKGVFGRGRVTKQFKGLKCLGNEKSLLDCKHGGWEESRWRFVPAAGVVCGTPQEQHFTITNSSGAIIISGVPKYMPMMNHTYHFPKPAAPNARLILYLQETWLERNRLEGDSIVTVKDGTNKTVYQSKNEDGEDGDVGVLDISSWPVRVEVYSSFLARGRGLFGVNIPFMVINESCRDYHISLTAGIGYIIVKMKNLKKSHRDNYRYITYYNSSTMEVPEVKESKNYPQKIIGRIGLDTLFTVSVFAFPYMYTDQDKPYRYCTKNIRTKDVKLRLAGGTTPNEGRVELLYGKYWSMVCGTTWDLNDAMVACRSLGLPDATRAFKKTEFGKAKRIGTRMNQVQCAGNETTLSDCPHDGWELGRCYSTSSVAGVRCGNP